MRTEQNGQDNNALDLVTRFLVGPILEAARWRVHVPTRGSFLLSHSRQHSVCGSLQGIYAVFPSLPFLQIFHHIETLNIANDTYIEY